jgi:hypothetical protein
MFDDVDADEALAAAFTEIRAAVDDLIDEQISRVKDSSDEAAPVRAAPWITDLGSAPRAADVLAAATSAPVSRVANHTEPGDHRPRPLPVAQPPAPSLVLEEAPKPKTAGRSGDDSSQQRLNALARRLDSRLRRARDASADRPKLPPDN